jgi:type IV secretion system protein VirB1
MLSSMLLAHLIAACAPNVGKRTMTSIVAVESGGSPFAIHDNTSVRSYFPTNAGDATSLATELIAAGHSVDLGLAQINDANLPNLGLSVRAAFDPCTNVRAGATILAEAYGRARTHFGDGQFALRRAIGAYNTGSLSAGDGYIASVVTASQSESVSRTIVDLPGPAAPAPARNPLVRAQAKLAPRPERTARPAAPSPDDAPVIVPITVVSNGMSNP